MHRCTRRHGCCHVFERVIVLKIMCSKRVCVRKRFVFEKGLCLKKVCVLNVPSLGSSRPVSYSLYSYSIYSDGHRAVCCVLEPCHLDLVRGSVVAPHLVSVAVMRTLMFSRMSTSMTTNTLTRSLFLYTYRPVSEVVTCLYACLNTCQYTCV